MKIIQTFMIIVSVFISLVHSQTLVYSKKIGSDGPPYPMQAIDINDLNVNGYASSYKYQNTVKNDSLYIFDLVTGNNVYSLKLPNLALSQTTKIIYIWAFKNLHASDNVWSVVYYFYNSSNNYELLIHSNGIERLKIVGTGMPSWYKFDESFYMSTKTTTASDSTFNLYLFRSNLVASIKDPIQKVKSAQILQNGTEIIAMLPVDMDGVVKWKLLQVDGKIIHSHEEAAATGLKLVRVDISTLQAGMYVLSSSVNGNSFVNLIQK